MLTAPGSAGYRVVCFDQRGQYELTGPMKSGAYSKALFTKDFLTVMMGRWPVRTGTPTWATVFGGLVARSAAIATPSRVRGLTLLDSVRTVQPVTPSTSGSPDLAHPSHWPSGARSVAGTCSAENTRPGQSPTVDALPSPAE
jgi:pimeloyl-ACP methyl ester carboxylesterase